MENLIKRSATGSEAVEGETVLQNLEPSVRKFKLPKIKVHFY